jgi:hypothetical protein
MRQAKLRGISQNDRKARVVGGTTRRASRSVITNGGCERKSEYCLLTSPASARFLPTLPNQEVPSTFAALSETKYYTVDLLIHHSLDATRVYTTIVGEHSSNTHL